MAEGTLYIGNKRYSSWSLRGWLAVQLAGLDVAEVVIPIAGHGPGSTPAVAAASPSGLVPCLEHRGARIWDSLAIGEYCAELAPGLWPADRVLRAHCRAISAEMHSGFRGLRQAMPMNLGKRFPGQGRTPEALADIARIEAIWQEARALSGGPFLGGAAFGLVDAMFAPVATRFLTWQPELAADSLDYVATLRAHPLMAAWYEAALNEPDAWLIPHYENPA
ncbi:glutathione S-transferase family protein [Siccirubricoccus phaeus]|uniref:glutathione S-transferase family protein n=1 Tax=Siccirubricoccus phaeus TaxID=2595053 RepID=UPI0011F0CA3E|nr:glutathione S-transferase family protein [Siccirubricoccus phaeus]